ncbi:MAG: SIMPL domain-containing protein [Bdellovibrionota bacterium]
MKNPIIAIFLLFISFTAIAAETPAPRQVMVSGECNHVVSPDRGSITLTVEFQNMDLSKATKEAAESYERVTSAIKKLNLKNFNLRTSEYSVNEIRRWENNKEVMKGYQARMGVWVSTSDIQRIGEIIAIASREKVKDVNSLQTYLSDEKQLQEEVACLEDAAKNARMKAEKLSAALGARLGDVLMMNETGKSLPQWPRPMMMQKNFAMRGMAMDTAESAPSVEAGQQNLSLTVQVAFGLK